MVNGGVETILGVFDDPLMGPILLFGLGGVMVEVYNDVALRHCPILPHEAHEMINEVVGAKLLAGFRGSEPCDVDALVATMVSVSQMAAGLAGSLKELDINPLMVMPKNHGVIALDAMAVLKGGAD